MGQRPLIIAIDGPAGAGKSTAAKRLADALGYLYVDSGAMYRAVALGCIQQGIDIDDPKEVGRVVRDMDIQLETTAQGLQVFLNGADVTDSIRSKKVGETVSQVALVPSVRARLVAIQQDMASRGGIVMDGRDIGTVVLPHADVKIYLTASDQERAKRRHKELQASGVDVSFEEVLHSIRTRDRMDKNRKVAPLKKADDAVVVDSTGISESEVVQKILSICRSRRKDSCCSID